MRHRRHVDDLGTIIENGEIIFENDDKNIKAISIMPRRRKVVRNYLNFLRYFNGEEVPAPVNGLCEIDEKSVEKLLDGHIGGKELINI